MILVTGANGPFGRLVVEQLLARIPAADLAVSVRDPAAAAPLEAQGVRVRHGDFNEPASLAEAFAGADTVFVNGTNYGTASASRAGQHAAAIRAAREAGASRIVYTSWQNLDDCALEMAADFAGTEKLLTESGASGEPCPAWTILRTTIGMAQSLARDVHWAKAAGELAAPAGDAHATPAAVPDLAEAAANVLTEFGHDNQVYELSSPDSLTWHDLAALATDLGDRQIRYRAISDDEARAQAVAAGFQPASAEMLISYYAAFRAGWANSPSADLSRLLRRPATSALEAVRLAVEL